ncbi:PH domain-containing protein [Levilactobacillus huananensis]|uniref:PH domain-containing protein n=1 Tax=Levilactobacillus huananensis TaxID=2486019 RepID=UPI000F779CF8|nr:PH domain-containing protein [Levilactobacillus huananensis]
MTKTKRTHPLGLLDHLAKSVKNWWPLFLIIIAQSQSWWGKLLIPAAILIFIIWPLISWWSISYRVTPTALEFHSGILVRHHEHIPYVRIQTVQRKQWFYLAPFHLEEVSVETASHEQGKPEVRLAAVKPEVAALIERYRQAVNAAPTDSTTAASTESVAIPTIQATYTLSTRTKWQFVLTSTGFIPILLVALGVYGKLPHNLIERLGSDLAHLSGLFLIIGGLAIALIAWLFTVVMLLIRYFHFRAIRTGDKIQVAKGLFQRNTITVPLQRIQAVRFKQNIFRQWLAIQTTQLLLASRAAAEDNNDDLVLLPAVTLQQSYADLRPFVDWAPTTSPDVSALNVTNGRRWLLVRNALLIALVPVAIATWLWPTWNALFDLVLIIAFGQGLFAANNTGGGIVNRHLLVLRTGHWWTRETYLVPLAKIQSVRLRQSIWMKRTHLMHLTVNVRHGNRNQAIALRYLTAEQAESIYNWYLTNAI